MHRDSSNGAATPLVLVTVGTDAFPFDRLIRWIDSWLVEGGAERVRCVVQHGSAGPAEHADSRALLDFREFEQLVAEADVIVTHGGPGTIVLCADRGKKPIVVARLPEHGEVVDGHQVPFARRLDAEGDIALVESEHELHSMLDRFLADPGLAQVVRNSDRGSAAALRFEELVGELFA
ncbi:MAG TPA: glycosyltransferase [Gaiellaceae bacterium]|nr:glycosyltransferase [Gaiellaceae bacterium]